MITKNEELLKAEKRFQNHKAVLDILDSERNITALSWREPGTNNYSFRAVMDGEFVYITGDIGTATLRLTEAATVKSLSTYWKSPSYFAEKILCSTDKYEYNYNIAKAELTERLNELKEFLDEEDEEDAEALENLNDAYTAMLDEFDSDKGFAGVSDGTLQQWMALDKSEDYDWIYSTGHVLSARIWLWLAAFEMAYDALMES